MDSTMAVFMMLGIIFLIIEYWYLSHLYKRDGYFLVILLIPAVETDIKLKIVPPNEEDAKPSKLDKWLNKTI